MVLDALSAEPVKLLIVGGIGTGKSTALEAIRQNFRDRGRRVLSRPAGAGPDAVIVVDDAHLLSAARLHELTSAAGNPECTLVVAAEPRDHDPDLRELFAAIEGERPRIVLQRLACDEVTAELFAATSGIPLLVKAVRDGDDVVNALIERLRRLESPELEGLLIASLGGDIGAADVAAALDVDHDVAATLIDRARATGLVEPSNTGEFLGSVHRAVSHILGSVRHRECETALLRTQLAMSSLSPALALTLAEHGLHDEELAQFLRRQATGDDPDSAHPARVYRAAVDAGATELRAALADSLALDGDCAAASAIADAMLSTSDPAERAAAVRIAAAVAMHDGNNAQAAQLFSWLGPYPDAVMGAAAVTVHLGAGDIPAARAAFSARHAGPPTAAAREAHSLAEGLLMTVDGQYLSAAAQLGQAAGTGSSGVQLVMPDSAAALATLAALHNGDSMRARSLIGKAVTSPRHRLLQAWVRMLDGHGGEDGPTLAGLHRRDALWSAALGTALARRNGDAGALQRHWNAGMEVLTESAVDLYCLLPLGELWVGAARLRQQERLRPTLEQAFAILARLGDPPAWSLPLHWAGVHAGIIANDPAAVAPHGQALAAAAPHSPFAAALAAAGRTWLRVLAGQVDADEVVTAARALADFGLTSDATRLAGQAALATGDPRISAMMLQAARDLKTAATETEGPDTGPAGAATVRRTASSAALSEREREVAELLLLGMPYRDIGAQLFISAKTVEHHVARIRRRLGAESRSEMLSMLRALLTPHNAVG